MSVPVPVPVPVNVPVNGITITNGRIVRETRHNDSEYAKWHYAVGPAPTEVDTVTGTSKGRKQTKPIYLDELEYTVVDVETTGGGVHSGHRITEICIVRVDAKGRPVHEYSTLVNPGRSIPPMITALTHIDNGMVRMAPRFEDIATDVYALLQGRIFVAHNAAFDWGFISAELVRTIGRPLTGKKLCTVRLARKTVPELHRRSLDALTYFFNVENEARHRAYGDARATAKVFRRMLGRVHDRNIETWQQLESLTLRRSQKKKRTAMPTPMEDV
jgi:DNA polymerase-3 subunit epsilon